MKKLFGTDGIRGYANLYPMTLDVCTKIAEILAKYFYSDLSDSLVVIGKDSRISCSMFENAISSYLASFGINIKLIGVCPTPAVPIAVQNLNARFGIMITASHNNFADNGIKIFNNKGLKLTDDEELIIESMFFDENCKHDLAKADKIGKIESDYNQIDFYVNKIKSYFSFSNADTKNFTLALDSSNGSFSYIAPDILRSFGFNVISSFDTPNGININDNCGATYPNIISELTTSNHANIGIAFDGDGDRLILSDENGNILDGDNIIFTLVKAYNLQNTEVVSTIMANCGLEKALNELNIKLIRTNVGDRNISEYMQKSDAIVGGESSGHVIIKDHALTGDGLFAALKILEYIIKSKQKPSVINSLFKKYPVVNKNVKVFNKAVVFNSNIQELINKFEKQLYGNGKLIVRASGTENLIRISAEGQSKEELQDIVNQLSNLIEQAGKQTQ